MKITYVDHKISTSRVFWEAALAEFGDLTAIQIDSFASTPKIIDPIAEQIWDSAPDHLFLGSGAVWDITTSSEMMHILRSGAFTSNRFYGDARMGWHERLMPGADVVDALFVTSQSYADMLPNAHFIPCPAWTAGSAPYVRDFGYDLVFVGGPRIEWSMERVNIVKGLKDLIGDRFGVFGEGWAAYGIDCHGINSYECMNRVYPRARAILSVTDTAHTGLGRYVSNRFWNGMHSGRPVIANHMDRMSEVVLPYVHYIELLQKTFIPENITRILGVYSDDELNRLGMRGRRWVRENNTYEVAARGILRVCGHDV